jgi:hypothetical protein
MLLGGCPTPGQFTGEFAVAKCHRIEECSEASFALLYDDVEQCTDASKERDEAVSACMIEHCRYDERAAQGCLDFVHGASCAEITDGEAWGSCGEVYFECDAREEECWNG